jgi:hypothetical protein
MPGKTVGPRLMFIPASPHFPPTPQPSATFSVSSPSYEDRHPSTLEGSRSTQGKTISR